MSRLRFYKRNPAHHERDPETEVCVELFLEALLDAKSRLQWFGSRTTDALSLYSQFSGLQLQFTYLIPESHEDYIYPLGLQGVCSGRRPEELLLKIKDVSRRHGRVMIMDEVFEQYSPLFEHALTVFKLLREGIEMPMATVHEKMPYAQNILEAAKLLQKV